MKKYFSHPHGLKLCIESDQNDDNPVICSVCEQNLCPGDPAYTCIESDCKFFLHKSCFELPRNLEHKSHPNHPLTLSSNPTDQYGLYYSCNACGYPVNGFSFQCERCDDDFRLHVKCSFFLPESVECKAHIKHALSIQYSTPKSAESDYDRFTCDVCGYYVKEGNWRYNCKDCNFDTHLECATSADSVIDQEEKVEEEEEEEEEGLSDHERLMRANIKAMNQMAILQFQMQMAKQNAQFISNLGKW